MSIRERLRKKLVVKQNDNFLSMFSWKAYLICHEKKEVVGCFEPRSLRCMADFFKSESEINGLGRAYHEVWTALFIILLACLICFVYFMWKFDIKCTNCFLYNLHGNLAYSEETSKRRTWIRVLHWPCAHSAQQSYQEACLYNTFRGAWWRRLPSRCFPQIKANWPEILDSLWHGLLLQGDRCTQSVRNQAVSAHSDDRFREACGLLWEHQQSPQHNGSGQQLLHVSKSSAFECLIYTTFLIVFLPQVWYYHWHMWMFCLYVQVTTAQGDPSVSTVSISFSSHHMMVKFKDIKCE